MPRPRQSVSAGSHREIDRSAARYLPGDDFLPCNRHPPTRGKDAGIAHPLVGENARPIPENILASGRLPRHEKNRNQAKQPDEQGSSTTTRRELFSSQHQPLLRRVVELRKRGIGHVSLVGVVKVLQDFVHRRRGVLCCTAACFPQNGQDPRKRGCLPRGCPASGGWFFEGR